jgi:hypothetical protein
MKKLFFLIPLFLLLPALSHAQMFPKDAITTSSYAYYDTSWDFECPTQVCTVLSYQAMTVAEGAISGSSYSNPILCSIPSVTVWAISYANSGIGNENLIQSVCRGDGVTKPHLTIQNNNPDTDLSMFATVTYVPYDIASTTPTSYSLTPVSVNTSSSGGLATVGLALSTLAGAVFFRRT